jgi:peptidoglycan hydrolase CwlO-like protein
MNLSILNGHFKKQDAIALLTQMVHIKIAFHESSITDASMIEEIKMHENRIKQLQKELQDVRNEINAVDGHIDLKGLIEIGIA